MSYYWNYKNVLNSTGQILFYSSFTFLFPFILSLFLKESLRVSFVYLLIFIFALLTGYLLLKSTKKKVFLGNDTLFNITLTQALIVVVFVWLLYAFFASLPFYFLSSELTLLDSYFESMSSLTTTGLTMYQNLIPPLKSLSLWRSFISWIGGLGIIMLAFFGFMKGKYGSSKLFSAEGHEKIRPNFKKTIRDMWVIYLVITLVGVILLNVFGMSLFDSFNYSMSAVSTNGSQSNAQGLKTIGNTPIYLTLIIILILGATSFFLHYSFYLKKSFKVYFNDKQFVYMLLIMLVSALLIFLKLNGSIDFVTVLFTVVGMMSCGGFVTFAGNNLLSISPFIFIIFLMLMFVGASTGSTTGGIKVERLILSIKSIFWRIRQVNLPDIAYFSKRYNGEIIDNAKIRYVYFLIFVYFLFVLLGVLVFTFHGYSIQESAFEVISAQSNVGISSGLTNLDMAPSLKIMLIINMWVGRLEIIPILSLLGILFSRKYLI
jgi:trk system potassium uptake protein TrkH